ncbi:hypothetical protein [Nonomuraea sp. SYSU D8015]|uniref:hypothetical protein n=1 Tax=Nonomuraea sp. SYSU D8015 TaxID=2593644 RepID=UPI001660A583|nr:hypothetical protein [Nonomuraea sp. SYSU D8015]
MTEHSNPTLSPVAATAPRPRPRASRRGDGRLVPAGLIALTVVPLIAGAVRLTELFTGAEVTSANARYFDAPTPVILHIFAASGYGVLGAFQFARGFRRRRPGWHRVSGRLLVPLGQHVLFSVRPVVLGAVAFLGRAGRRRLQQDRPRRCQPGGRHPQPGQVAQLLLVGRPAGPGQQHRRHQQVEQQQRVIDRGALQLPHRGQQGGQAAVLLPPFDPERLGHHPEAGQLGQLHRRHRSAVHRPRAQPQHVRGAIQRLLHPGARQPGHRRTHPLQSGDLLTVRHLQGRHQLGPHQRRRNLRQAAVDRLQHGPAHLGDQPGQGGDTRQQHPVGNQPQHRPIEQLHAARH